MLRLLFVMVECGIARFLCAMCVVEIRASSSSLGYVCAKLSFFHGLHCWVHREKSRAQSLNRSLTQLIRCPRNRSAYTSGKNQLQTDNNTRSSDVVTLARPSSASSLKVTDRSFQYASPHLWNALPFLLREPVSPLYTYLNPSFCSPLSPSITPLLFHSKLKTYLFGKSFPP